MSSINRSSAGLKHNHLLVHCKVSKRFLICNKGKEKLIKKIPAEVIGGNRIRLGRDALKGKTTRVRARASAMRFESSPLLAFWVLTRHWRNSIIVFG